MTRDAVAVIGIRARPLQREEQPAVPLRVIEGRDSGGACGAASEARGRSG